MTSSCTSSKSSCASRSRSRSKADASSTSTRSPQSALYRTSTGFQLIVDLPGVDSQAIQVEMKGHRLHLQAPSQHGFTYKRTYPFKSSHVWGDMQANWDAGRLYLTLPTQTPQVQNIPISVAPAS